VNLLLAIDPGSEKSGHVVLDLDNSVYQSGVLPNHMMLEAVRFWLGDIAIEHVEARGMPLGNSTIDTIFWTGRFMQAYHDPDSVQLTHRRDVKLYLCGSTKAKDPNVRQALIDLFPATGGGKVPQIGIKALPGPLYGISTHAWAALGVAATVRRLEAPKP
jgi:hypothetical protein